MLEVNWGLGRLGPCEPAIQIFTSSVPMRANCRYIWLRSIDRHLLPRAGAPEYLPVLRQLINEVRPDFFWPLHDDEDRYRGRSQRPRRSYVHPYSRCSEALPGQVSLLHRLRSGRCAGTRNHFIEREVWTSHTRSNDFKAKRGCGPLTEPAEQVPIAWMIWRKRSPG